VGWEDSYLTCGFFRMSCGCGRGKCRRCSPPKLVYRDLIDEYCNTDNWVNCLVYSGECDE
jgi:hypothetical protein